MGPLHLAVTLLLLAGPAHAPTPDEQRLFAEGLKAFDAGDARAAETAWKQGYAIAHDPAFLVRIGEAQEKAGAPAEAAESYRRYVREAPDASDRADIEQRLARLAPASAPPLAPGDKTEPAHEFGSGPAPRLPTGPAPRAGGGAADVETAHRGTEEDEGSGWNAYNITAWSATAATAVLLGTAAFFGAQASSKESDVNRLLTFRDEKGVPLTFTPEVMRQYQDAIADGKQDARNAKLLLLGAAGTAVVATTFFLIDGMRPAHAAVALAPAPAGSGALGTFAWRF